LGADDGEFDGALAADDGSAFRRSHAMRPPPRATSNAASAV
jgi:hypothetical protein